MVLARTYCIYMLQFFAVGLLIAISACASEGIANQDLKSGSSHSAQLAEFVSAIAVEENSRARYDLAQNMFLFIYWTSQSDGLSVFDDTSIDAVAELLTDDGADEWAIRILGQFGPRANRFVPQLEAALEVAWAEEQAQFVLTSVSAVDGICRALSRITLMHPFPHEACEPLPDRER